MEKNDDVKVFWCAKLAALAKKLLGTIPQSNAKRPKWLALCKVLYLGRSHQDKFTL